MTRTLILMRHAKSSWSNPQVADHDRPLNQRGQQAARSLGAWLHESDILPDQVLCSSAVRAQLTYQGLAIGLPAPTVPALYLADPDAMLKILQSATGQSVLMIGHNPGIAGLARLLVRQPPTSARFHDYPTGATLVADFDIPGWAQLTFGMGDVRDFVLPRSLPKA